MQRFKEWYRRNRDMLRWPLCAAIIMILLLYVPTPFAAYEPGLAISTKPLVQAERPDEPGTGQFYLMTVKLTDANFWMALRTAWDRDIELFMRKELTQGKTMKEYEERMNVVMQDSQSTAIEAAYRQAGIPYSIVPERLVVAAVSGGEPAQGQGLLEGDEIVQMNGREVRSVLQADAVLRSLQGESELEVVVWRQGKERKLVLQLAASPAGELKQQNDPAASVTDALGGITLTELRSIVPENPAYRVQIEASGIGGPSAGLMFALQTVDRLTSGDLTHGLRIAGTGTISPEGNVGPIGGAALKIAAANQAGVQLFFVPKANAREARKRAEQLGAAMEIVEVETLQQAVAYLEER